MPDLHQALVDFMHEHAPNLKWTLGESAQGISLSIFYPVPDHSTQPPASE